MGKLVRSLDMSFVRRETIQLGSSSHSSSKNMLKSSVQGNPEGTMTQAVSSNTPAKAEALHHVSK